MQDSLDLRALRDIGLTHDTVQAALAQGRPRDTRLARVIEIRRDRWTLHDGDRAHDATPWPTLRVALELARDALVVGDWVWWRDSPGDARGWIVARAPARNRLSRRDPAGGRQGLVANVDTALLVMGLDRDFNLRRLDRFLVIAHLASVGAAVVLSKADRCADPEAAVERVRAHVGGGDAAPQVLAVDARSDAARAAVSPWLARGRTLVMLGSSGAGKTTLTDTLAGRAGATQAVRAGDERGQHTTTVRTLHRTAGGACVIDTPGLRQLWLDADADTLDGAFPEIGLFAAGCRYRDCRHEHEPGCAVREGVPAARLESLRKLLREADRGQGDLVQRRRRHAFHKQRARDNRERLALKNGG